MDEGDTGTVRARFTVTLSHASGQTVTVDYMTADGTATTNDNDYVATNGTLTFAPGETEKTITVMVNGDVAVDPWPDGGGGETFQVILSTPTGGATIVDGVGVGTILESEPDVGNANDTYVSYIKYHQIPRNKKQMLDLVRFDTRYDSNADGRIVNGSQTDLAVGAVTVNFTLYGPDGSSLWFCTTADNGTFDGQFRGGLTPGDYTLQITSIEHDTYAWNQYLGYSTFDFTVPDDEIAIGIPIAENPGETSVGSDPNGSTARLLGFNVEVGSTSESSISRSSRASSAAVADLALLAWLEPDSSEDDADPLALPSADELALMMME